MRLNCTHQLLCYLGANFDDRAGRARRSIPNNAPGHDVRDGARCTRSLPIGRGTPPFKSQQSSGHRSLIRLGGQRALSLFFRDYRPTNRNQTSRSRRASRGCQTGCQLKMPVVQIITTGGTIASRIDPATGAAFPVMRATELVGADTGMSQHAQVGVDEFGLVSSWDMTPATVLRLARTIRSTLAAGDVDGVVVTHGTDTMEESAFALDLLFDGEQPVVITGAMRNASQPGSDGPRNLLSAVRVAASINTRGLGVAVVMNDQMHAPRYVTKSHTTATDTMISPGVGPIGTVDDSGVWLRWRPARLPRMPWSSRSRAYTWFEWPRGWMTSSCACFIASERAEW